MITNRPFTKLLSVLALAVVLSACDSGGVGTSSNPDLSTANNGFAYTGAAARDIAVSNFQFYLWRNVTDVTRCGGCHNSEASSPVTPLFFDTSNVNVAYDATVARDPALLDMTTVNPLNAVFVDKLNNGHFCWETNDTICATLIAGWIDDWKNAANGGAVARQINLTAPANIRDPGDSKSFPASATTLGTNGTSFANTVYPLVEGSNPVINLNNCQNCHTEGPGLSQAPFFAHIDVDVAYEAAKSKMDIDTPANSRLALRLFEQHNCWSTCGPNEALMVQRITDFANGIAVSSIDPTLVTSKALTLGEGIIASGGNRAETNQFAIWEFKTGSGLTAYDTSGVGASINLSLIGSVNWVGGYGLEFTGGRAQADTISSDKIFTYLQDTREYAIEAWVIPNNVTQEDANIVSYSGGDLSRNFTLGQDMYNYESYNRVDSVIPNPNGEPVMSTGEDDEELAQASLQHVVINYDPLDRIGNGAGRSIYVNGQLVNNLTDNATGLSIANVWDDTFAFILGNEISGSRPWMGQVKMVALHSQPLPETDIQQNFDLGVGQKFLLLFYVGHHLGETGNPNSFIVFEVAQFDSYSYLFNKPTFVTLDGSAPSTDISIKGLRIGINGKEALVGQSYSNLDTSVIAATYDPATGQELSPKGTIISLEKGPDSDEFFLTFEDFNGVTKAFADTVPTVAADPADPANPAESDIGMRTFEEINATIAAITGVPVINNAVDGVYDDYMQQLPTVEAIDAFLPSHQMAVAQLALTSCSELVDNNGTIPRSVYFPGFVFTDPEGTAFNTSTKRDQIIQPLLTAAMNVDVGNPLLNNLTTQPDQTEISDLLGSTSPQDLDPALAGDAYDSLITQLLNGPCNAPECIANSASRTQQIVKSVCAVATGGAVMLVQ